MEMYILKGYKYNSLRTTELNSHTGLNCKTNVLQYGRLTRSLTLMQVAVQFFQGFHDLFSA